MSIQAALAVSLFNMLSLRASRVLAPLFAIQFGANPFVIGLLAAMDSIFPLFIALYAGKLSDRLGARLPMMIGSAGTSVGLMVPFFAPSLPGLFASAALIGVSHVFYTVSMQNLIGSLSGPELRTRNFSNYSLALSFGSLLGPLAAGLGIDALGHASAYLLASAGPLVALAILAASAKNLPAPQQAQGESRSGSSLDLWRTPALRRVFIVGGMLLTGIDLFHFYMPIYGYSLGLSASVIGMVMSMFSLASFSVRTVLPSLARRTGEEPLLIYAMFVGAAVYVGLPWVPSPWLLGAASFVLGFGLGCGQPLAMTVIYSHCPPGRSGEALGVRVTINNFMHVAVPIVFGAIGATLGLASVFWVSAALLGGSAWLGRRSNQSTPRPFPPPRAGEG